MTRINTCVSMSDVRENIDRIDKDLVKLLSERSRYVKKAAEFKKDEQDVRAPARVEDVVSKVRELSQNEGFNPNITEQIYRTMIDCFINMELEEFEGQNNN
ncbi:chorismate mutase [Alphaproteobacteria bacterium 46_93_T64]|nr:chorismate mutase [Alphaproteobacteria bacterium 46_93_T64]